MTEMPVSRPSNDRTGDGRRRVSFLLGLGIFFLPIIFVWFLLRRGHSTMSRILGFAWLVVFLIVSFGNSPDSARPAASPPVGDTSKSSSTPATPVRPPSKAELAAQAAVEKARELEAEWRDVRRSPENFLQLERINGTKGGFDTVLILSGRIKNTSNFDIKDPTLDCTLTGPSGTQVGSVRETLFEVVPKNGSRSFRDLNMGFMGSSQVAQFNCRITDGEAMGG